MENWNYSILGRTEYGRSQKWRSLPPRWYRWRILIFMKFSLRLVAGKRTPFVSSCFVSYNNGSDRRVTRCVKRTCLKVLLYVARWMRRDTGYDERTFRFEWKGLAVVLRCNFKVHRPILVESFRQLIFYESSSIKRMEENFIQAKLSIQFRDWSTPHVGSRAFYDSNEKRNHRFSFRIF